jgi:hypothetical protein
MNKYLGLSLFSLVLASSIAYGAEGSIKIDKHARLMDSGAAQITLAVSCAGGGVLEANVSISQEKRRASGMNGFGGVICDGSVQERTVTVSSFDGPFRRGPAYASAFLSVCDGNFNCASVNETRQIVIR